MDAGVAAPEGGLRGHLYGERHGGGGGLASSVMRMAWSGRWGILLLAVLRLWQQPDCGSEF
jgi:hypothetical protein